MKLSLKPEHEALAAGVLMVLALIGLGFVVAHDYAGRLPPGEVSDKYRAPLVRIRAVSGRIRSALVAHIPLGELDKLYEERELVPPPTDGGSGEPNARESGLSTTDLSGLRLTGIAWSDRRPVAFVGGRGVTVGETVAGWRVDEILPESVRLTDDAGNERQIGLYGESAQ